jgi:hypothetical protein
MTAYSTVLRFRRAFLVLLVGLALFLAYSHARPNIGRFSQKGFVPKEGFVPNEEVATAIAEAVLSPVYGKATVISERPFKAKLDDGTWDVSGSVPCTNPPVGATCPGGSAEIRISKRTGQILYMNHSQ